MSLAIDDGFCSHLVENAEFCGKFEIPLIKKQVIAKPTSLVPFSARKRSDGKDDFICFYEHDKKFEKFIENPHMFIGDLKKFKGIISPDCSLYLDMPLCLQITDIYFNRAIGHYFQSKGLNVVPNIRWGDQRTFQPDFLSEPIAFTGIEKGSVVAIGTYGQIQSKENRLLFKEGLNAMMKYVGPEIVYVYGRMPENIFGDFIGNCKFVKFSDWISVKKGDKNGYRN